MGIFDTMRVSVSGLSAQRLRMDVIASNVANVDSTKTPDGGPYLRRQVIFEAAPQQPEQSGQFLTASQPATLADTLSVGDGVKVVEIQQDPNAVKRVYDPTNPDADNQGYVTKPDIDVVTEVTDMLAASRAYEANITVLNATKSMALKALSIGQA